jgi:predicted nucleic acid-binding protein
LIVAVDTSILILLFDEKANGPKDPETGKPVDGCQARVRHLVDTLAKTKGSKIIIPTPSLGEFLVRSTPLAASLYISTLERLRGVRISPFSVRAAIEFAELQRAALSEGKRPKPGELQHRAKPKFDHQIVAIALAEKATVIYSDDEGLGRFAKRAGIKTIGVRQLPLPPVDAQGQLPLEPPEAVPVASSDDD